MKINEIYNCSGLVEYINEIGFLPLLHMGLDGWSAEEAAVTSRCPTADGNGRYGNGKATSSGRADAHTASSLTGKLPS